MRQRLELECLAVIASEAKQSTTGSDMLPV
jgi:hypothetical protein